MTSAVEVHPPPVSVRDYLPQWLEGDLTRAVIGLVRLEQDKAGVSAMEAGGRVLVRLRELAKG